MWPRRRGDGVSASASFKHDLFENAGATPASVILAPALVQAQPSIGQLLDPVDGLATPKAALSVEMRVAKRQRIAIDRSDQEAEANGPAGVSSENDTPVVSEHELRRLADLASRRVLDLPKAPTVKVI
jgi:hypothetical protein